MHPQIKDAIGMLQELKEEQGINKNFKEKADKVISLLEQNSELALDKAVFGLEEITFLELASYHRTQVWDVLSLVEGIKKELLSQPKF